MLNVALAFSLAGALGATSLLRGRGMCRGSASAELEITLFTLGLQAIGLAIAFGAANLLLSLFRRAAHLRALAPVARHLPAAAIALAAVAPFALPVLLALGPCRAWP